MTDDTLTDDTLRISTKVRFPKGTHVTCVIASRDRHLAVGDTGIVVGHSWRFPWTHIAVVRDGRRARHRYHIQYWTPTPAEVTHGS